MGKTEHGRFILCSIHSARPAIAPCLYFLISEKLFTDVHSAQTLGKETDLGTMISARRLASTFALDLVAVST